MVSFAFPLFMVMIGGVEADPRSVPRGNLTKRKLSVKNKTKQSQFYTVTVPLPIVAAGQGSGSDVDIMLILKCSKSQIIFNPEALSLVVIPNYTSHTHTPSSMAPL